MLTNGPCDACEPRSIITRGLLRPQRPLRCCSNRSCVVTCHRVRVGNVIGAKPASDEAATIDSNDGFWLACILSLATIFFSARL